MPADRKMKPCPKSLFSVGLVLQISVMWSWGCKAWNCYENLNVSVTMLENWDFMAFKWASMGKISDFIHVSKQPLQLSRDFWTIW